MLTLTLLVGQAVGDVGRHVDVCFVNCGVGMVVEELIDAGKESLS